MYNKHVVSTSLSNSLCHRGFGKSFQKATGKHNCGKSPFYSEKSRHFDWAIFNSKL